jgi:DNA-directed RNA polymerase subunit RPC12/RpoP
MADFVTLSCPNCGGKLEITSDIERFACAYCGQEQLVNRGRGIVTLKPVLDQLASVKQSVDRNVETSERVANELALQRVKKEKAEAEVALKATLEQIEKRSNVVNFSLAIGVLLIACSFLVFWSNLSTDRVGSGLGCLILGIPIGALLLYPSLQQSAKLRREEETARTPLLRLQKQEQEILARLKQTT